MRKFLSVLLCLLTVLSVLGAGSFTALAGSKYSYEWIYEDYYDEDGEETEREKPVWETEYTDAYGMTVKRYNGDETDVIVPDAIGGLPVTAVGDYCFYDNANIQTVTLPDTVKAVGKRAFFSCKKLTAVNLAKVETVGNLAFKNCKKLEKADLNSAKTIGCEAFRNCTALKTVTIDAIEVIEKQAFYASGIYRAAIDGNKKALYLENVLINAFTDRTKGKFTVKTGTRMLADNAFTKADSAKKATMTTVVLPNSVRVIGANALNASGITKIKFPKDLQRLGENAFGSQFLKKNRTYKNGCYYVGKYLIGSDRYTLNVKIKKGTTLIADGALSRILNKTLEIPEGVRYIGNHAITGAQRLKTVSIPKSVIAIGENNFVGYSGCIDDNCKSLTAIKVDKKNKKYAAKNGVLYNKKKTALICYPNNKKGKSFTVPSTVKTIRSHAFSYANNLKTVKLNDGLKKIEREAFNNCCLKKVTVPESVTFIGRCAFGFDYFRNEDEGGFFLLSDFKLRGKKGSAAEQYCNDRVVAYNYDDTVNYLSTPIPFEEVA